MIKSDKAIKHKGLKRFVQFGKTQGLHPEHIKEIREIMTLLNGATELKDLSAPKYKLHELKGDRKGTWSMTVRANWRITFKFKYGYAKDIDYEDYH